MIEQQNAEVVEKAKSEQIKAQIAQSAPFLGKWLSILFWVTIISILAGILRYKKIAELVPALYSLGWIISVLCMIARGLVLLMMCSESFRYFKSGICSLVAAIFNALPAIIISGAIDDLILYFFLFVVELILFVTLFVGEYYEYTGHAEVLQHVDIVQSEKWRKLWKWYIGIPIVLIGCLILVYLLPDSQYWRTSNIFVLNVLLIVLCVVSIGVFIVAILKYVYLYRTAKIFKWYS